MRVLLTTDVFPPRCGGSGWSTYHLARALRQRGHEVAILRAALDPRAAAPYDYDGFRVDQVAVLAPPVPVLRNVAKNELFWAVGAAAIARAARTHGAEIIHGQHVMTIPATTRAARRIGVPTVATVRDYWGTCPISTRLRPEGVCEACSVPRLVECLADHHPARYPLVGILQGYVRGNRLRRQAGLASADAVVAVSRFVAEDLRVHAGIEAVVIPNLVEVPEDLPPPPDGMPERPYAIFVGKLDRHKGADLLPEIVSATGRDIHLVVIGAGPLRGELEERCQALGIVPHMFESLPNADVVRWLAHARALLFPARWPEPLSRVLLEAASVGCPIIATPTGGTPDTLIDWVSGFLADRFGDFPLRLRQLVDDEHVHALMRRAARNVARQRFATEVVVGKMETLYASLLTRL